MKCLVTGSCGFIGSHLCEKLIAEGHEVIGVDDLSTGNLKNLFAIKDHINFKFYRQDICEFDTYVARGVDWVFHLAGKADVVPSIDFPYDYHHNNVTGTMLMLEAARNIGAKRFIYAASSSCYGKIGRSAGPICQPEHPYGLTKYLGEQYVFHWAKVYGLSTVSLRLFNVYGPRSRTNGAYGAVFGTFLSQLANGKPLTVIGDGRQSRDFVFIFDAVDAFIRAAKDNCGGYFDVGTGEPQTINRLVDLLGPTAFVNIPDRPGEPRETLANPDEAFAVLGWEPKIPFEDGVKIMKSLVDDYKDAPLWTPEKIEVSTERWFKHLGKNHENRR